MDFDAALAEITESVFQATLGFSIAPGPPFQALPAGLSGTVEISGAFEGSVVIESTAVFARMGAAIMFNRDEDQIAPEEMADTLGELANMIAGNLKALVGGGCTLSLPLVFESSPSGAADLRAVKCTLSLTSAGEPVRVQLLEN